MGDTEESNLVVMTLMLSFSGEKVDDDRVTAVI